MRNSGVRHIARKAPAFRGHRFGGHHRDAFSGGAPTASGPVAAPPSRIRGGDGDGRGAPRQGTATGAHRAVEGRDGTGAPARAVRRRLLCRPVSAAFSRPPPDAAAWCPEPSIR
ncbi:hypothetical protein GCM10009605_03360 [Nocardiopsis composta]